VYHLYIYIYIKKKKSVVRITTTFIAKLLQT